MIRMLCYWLVWKNASFFFRVEEENMQNFFHVQETPVFNKTAASIQERNARKCLTSSFPDMSSLSFLSGSTTTPVPFSPATIILEPMPSSKGHCSGGDHRVPVWMLVRKLVTISSNGLMNYLRQILQRSLTMKLEC